MSCVGKPRYCLNDIAIFRHLLNTYYFTLPINANKHGPCLQIDIYDPLLLPRAAAVSSSEAVVVTARVCQALMVSLPRHASK
eukprot:12511600-Heterocapsa_arctica.AAC.1